MKDFDAIILLERVYVEGLTKEGLSQETLDKIRVILEENKPNIDSVFGIAYQEDYDGEEVMFVYVSDKLTWKKDGHCCDHVMDDSRNVLFDMGFAEDMESIYTPNCDLVKADAVPSREELKAKLINLGFEYDEAFENFMKNSFE